MTEPPIACSLGADDLRARRARWDALAHRALQANDVIEGGRRLRYANLPGVADELRELIALEARCCPFLAFTLDERPDELVLDIAGPVEAATPS